MADQGLAQDCKHLPDFLSYQLYIKININNMYYRYENQPSQGSGKNDGAVH